MLNLSKSTKELLCWLIPYKIPSFELKSKETKGKTLERGPVFIGFETSSLSRPQGEVEIKPSLC